jgi:hypothetical protein
MIEQDTVEAPLKCIGGCLSIHFFPALTFAHRALCAAAIRRRAVADSVLLPRFTPFFELTPLRA